MGVLALKTAAAFLSISFIFGFLNFYSCASRYILGLIRSNHKGFKVELFNSTVEFEDLIFKQIMKYDSEILLYYLQLGSFHSYALIFMRYKSHYARLYCVVYITLFINYHRKLSTGIF